jgi:hypothetical protein
MLTETFGYILVASALVLGLWEYRAYARRDTEAWLATRRRLRRRTLVCIVLAAIGVVFALEGRGVLPMQRIPVLMAYVASLATLSILLVILAGIDLVDTLKSAADQSVREFDESVSRSRGGPEPESPDRDGP